MHIGEVLNAVYDEEVGWRPASGAIKPVHVANGLVRALSGKYYDTSKINNFIVWLRNGKIIEEREFNKIIKEDTNHVFECFHDSQENFDQIRKYAKGILGADKAVFPTADKSSLTLACSQMASRDGSDYGLGDFGAQLLGAPSDEDSLAYVLRRELSVKKPDDAVTAIVWPLLDHDGKAYDQKDKKRSRTQGALSRRHNKACTAALRAAASCLATHERSQGNRLRMLQRAVQFVCVATHAHAQSLAAGGDLSKRPPGLLALRGRRSSDIATASARSVDLIYERLVLWLSERLAERIENLRPLELEGMEIISISAADGRSAKPIFKKIKAAKKPHNDPDEETVEARMEDFDLARGLFGKDDPALVLGHALVSSYLREYESGGPRAFLQGLARKSGLLFPHFQGGPKEKRLRPSIPVLDMLVRACVKAGEIITLEHFLERLWERFGLIVGGRETDEWSDGEFLHKQDVKIDQSALSANTLDLVEQLVCMGLARRYPDNVTFIGDGHA